MNYYEYNTGSVAREGFSRAAIPALDDPFAAAIRRAIDIARMTDDAPVQDYDGIQVQEHALDA